MTEIHKYTIGKIEVEIEEPGFKEVSYALSLLMKASGGLDMASAGKAIFDICCKKGKEEIEKNTQALVSFCMRLCDDFVIPAEIEIKKN